MGAPKQKNLAQLKSECLEAMARERKVASAERRVVEAATAWEARFNTYGSQNLAAGFKSSELIHVEAELLAAVRALNALATTDTRAPKGE